MEFFQKFLKQNSKLLIRSFHIELVKGGNRINLSDYISDLPNRQINFFNCMSFGVNEEYSFNTTIVGQKEVAIYSDKSVNFQVAYLTAIIGY